MKIIINQVKSNYFLPSYPKRERDKENSIRKGLWDCVRIQGVGQNDEFGL